MTDFRKLAADRALVILDLRRLLTTKQGRLAQAYAEGYKAAIEDYGCDIPWGGTEPWRNPYQTETGDGEVL